VGHDRDHLYRVRPGEEVTDESVAGLVIRDEPPLLVAEEERPARAQHNLLARYGEVGVLVRYMPDTYLLSANASSQAWGVR
jgi:hypothetical protein